MPAAGPRMPPQQLQWRLDVPLDEKTTYLAWVSGNVSDDTGKGIIANPVFALARLSNPLVDANGHTTVSLLTDDQATKLEPLRKAMQPAIDGLVAHGVPRENLALAWAFTTQSEATILDLLQGYPSNAMLGLPDTPLYVFDATQQYQNLAAVPASAIRNFGNIGKVLVGVFPTAVAVTGPGGTLNPYAPQILPVTFTLALPSHPPPMTGYPVTIFGHGFGESREDFIRIAGALADSTTLGPLAQATIATDLLFHGERSSCTGSTAFTMKPTDDGACADPVHQMCNEDPLVGRCVARSNMPTLPCKPGTADDYNVCAVAGQGACIGKSGAMMGTCEGGDFLRENYATLVGTPGQNLIPFQRPLISGWNMFSLTNYFSTRDNFRQDVIDLAQLVRVIKSTTPMTSLTAQAQVSFDLTRLSYVGQSLGSILGTLYNAVSPDVTNVALNVGGGDLPQIILNGGYFASFKAALLAALATQNIKPGTPEFDQFIGIAQWVLDPADPANMAWRLTHPVSVNGVSTPNANRKAFIQFIQGDDTVPNISNFALLAAADRPFGATPPGFGCKAPLNCYEFTEQIDGFDATSAPIQYRHGFLLWPPSMDITMPSTAAANLTNTAQTQVATFLSAGHLP
jgi:hypothetical protein